MAIQKEFKNLSIMFSIIVLIGLSIFIVWKILHPILYGLILAFIFFPLYKKSLNFTKDNNLSAFIMVLIIIFVVALPLWFLFPAILQQSFDMYLYLQKIDLGGIFNRILPSLISTDLSNNFILSMNKFISSTASKFFTAATSSLINLPILVLKLTVCMFVFFFALRDEQLLKKGLKLISPFEPELEKKLTKNFDDITKSVLYGFVLIGIFQGFLTGVGLVICKVPHALFLTLISMIAAVIPIIGAWIVWIPASIYLFLTGHTVAGIGLFLWGAIVVSWIDNILRPYIVAKRAEIPTSIVFIGMMGGLISLGFIGLIIGPLILSYLLVLLENYKNHKNNN